MTETTNQNGGEGGAEKPASFQLGENGPRVSAEPKLAAYLQGKGDSPVGYAQSAPPNEDARVTEDESTGPVLKTTDLTVSRDNTPSVKRPRKTNE